MSDFYKLRLFQTMLCGECLKVLCAFTTLMLLMLPSAIAQQASAAHSDGATITGFVRGFDGRPVSEATVTLEKKDQPDDLEMKTKADGAFVFSRVSGGSYQLSAKGSGLQSDVVSVIVLPGSGTKKVDLTFQKTGLTEPFGASRQSAAQDMVFIDQPNFIVAGVTDWTAVGGHGSDSILRTSESLASDTATLRPGDAGRAATRDSKTENESEGRLLAALADAPDRFDTNHQLGEFYLSNKRYQEAIPLLEKAYRIDSTNQANRYDLGLAYVQKGDLTKASGRIRELLEGDQSSGLHRLLGELDEKLADPLSAVHEYEQAVRLDPSEQNYFDWGSELLLHRAVWQAQEVFRRGADAYPRSARMQTALGTALFAAARYDEAALHLCAASDLNPHDRSPYIFMGKIQMAAPNSLACIEPRLARFVQQEPGNSVANYLYAMSILKHLEQTPDAHATQHAADLLEKAVAIDPKCGEAYLQLGIISASKQSFEIAIGFYKKAIEMNPQLADAYYRLAMAYDRTGQPSKAKEELLRHDQIKQEQEEATDRQRREIKQFLIVQPGDTGISAIK